MRGFVIRAQSGFFTAETEHGELVCQLRGRLKKGRRMGDVVAVGDWVQVTPLGGKNGVIEQVEPRQHMFARLAPDPQGEYLQILIANPSQVMLVFACAEPAPRLGMLDRFLVIAEKQGIPALIVVNKIDLTGLEGAREVFGHYPALGYEVVYTSVPQNCGLAVLRDRLAHKITLLTGPSGVGKSSLLNAIQPGLGLQVRQISQATSKGRHTTVVRQLFPLEGGGYVADTPGLKALALWDIEPEELDGYFPELRSRVAGCAFSDCTHVHEPACAVRQAVEADQIHPARYQSYLRMRFGDED
ncbi:MAG: ribosome small subunit-dependent GTPase A [Chloroflexi bacterium RBG_16_57_11]|nr:MAG: ribosome small subunit-dependent GTPase A [Chloroflexi bacterium RBG_16_57_11]